MSLDRVRAKMVVNQITDYGSTLQYNFGCVYSSDPESENAQFSTSTPSGSFQISISKEKANPEVHAFLSLLMNQEVYIDVIPVPGSLWRWCEDKLPQSTETKKVVFREGKEGIPIVGKVVPNEPGKSVYISFVELEDGRKLSNERVRVGDSGNYRSQLYGWYWKYAD